ALPPFSIIISTVASPRPDAPPVTSATAPASFMGRLHSQIGRPTPGEACAGAAHRGDSGPMRLEARGHPLHTRALSLVLAARAAPARPAGQRVFRRDVVIDGHESAAAEMQLTAQTTDLHFAPAGAVVRPMERFAEQLEVRLVVEVEFPALTIGRLEAAERRRG